MTNRHYRLSEVALINPTFDRASNFRPDTPVAFVPMAAVSSELGQVTAHETRSLESVVKGFTSFVRGDILVAKITPCFENGKIVRADIRHELGFGSTEFHVIRPYVDRLDARYALHFMRQPSVRLAGERKMTGSAGQRRVPQHFLTGLEIPVPPLEEQRRIAATLDQAEALRRKRRESLAKLDVLLQSVFLDLFVMGGSSRWQIVTVGEVAAPRKDSIRTGPFGSQLLHSEFVDSGVAVLGIDNAVGNTFAWKVSRYITPEKYQQLRRYTVFPGDVIITIMGTCGRCAIVPSTVPLAINTKHLCCVSLDQNRCLPEFLHGCLLFHPTVRRQLSDSTRGAIMEGLNMGIIKSLSFALPPLAVQAQYVSTRNQILKLREKLSLSQTTLDTAYAALQQRSFSGSIEQGLER